MDKTIPELQALYKTLMQKDAPSRYKNDEDWLKGKIGAAAKAGVEASEAIDAAKEEECCGKTCGIVIPEEGEKTMAHVYKAEEGVELKYVRTYSLEVHGKDFAKIAEYFCERGGHEIEYE